MSAAFFEKLYAEHRIPYALDLIFKLVDDLLDDYSFQSMDEFMARHGSLPVFYHEAKNPNFAALDAVIRDVDLTRVSSTVALGFLSAPYSARAHLKEYAPYRERFRKHLIKTQSRKYAKDLLGNLFK